MKGYSRPVSKYSSVSDSVTEYLISRSKFLVRVYDNNSGSVLIGRIPTVNMQKSSRTVKYFSFNW